MGMTRICATFDVNEEINRRSCWKFPNTLSRVLQTTFDMPIWSNNQFLLTVTIEVLIHGACFVPFMSIKGPVGQKTSVEALIILIVGCCSLFVGRGLGYLLHERSLNAVPLYHVSLTLIINGLSLLMCAKAINDFAKMLPYFELFEFFFVRKFNTICGQISLVRGVSSFVGILIAAYIQRPDNDGRSALGNSDDVYVYAGLLMLAGGVCAALLRPLSTRVAAAAARVDADSQWPAVSREDQNYVGRNDVDSGRWSRRDDAGDRDGAACQKR